MSPAAMSTTTDANPPTSELMVRALYWLLLLASLGALGSATFEGFTHDASLWPVTLATTALSSPLLQPAYVGVTYVLPAAAVLSLFICIGALRRRRRELARISFFLALWAAMLVAGGTIVADWLYLPSLSWLAGRPEGTGE